jgi:PAS domain-containing protein
VLDAGLKVVQANRAFVRTFRVTDREIEGRPIYELGDRQWDVPELRRLLEEVLSGRGEMTDYEVEAEFPHVGRKRLVLNARRIDRDGGRPDLILLAMEEK